MTDPGWERGGGWLDGVLGQLWAPAKAAVQHLVLEKLDQAMRTSKPKMFSTLGFSHLELGSRPIRILGVKHYAGLTEESLLDVEVEFVQGEDSLVQFEVGLTALPGVAPFVIELKELVFRAELRLSLAPLLERLPVVGALSLAFTKKPDLDFRLQALRLDVMDLPFVYQGLGALLEGALSSMIWPRMLTFPFTELDARALGRIRHPPPRGVLFVRIIAAKDLTGAMESLLGWHPGLKYTTRRSCVKVRLLQDASQSFTTQLRYGVHPTYGETGELIVHEPQTAQLEFTVLREARLQDSVLSRPRVLGEATFTLESTGLLRGGTPRGDEDDSGSKGGGVPAGDGGDGSDGGSDNSNGTTGDGGDNDGSDLFQERRILRNIPLLGGSGSSGGDARPPCIDVELVWRPVAPPCPDEGRNGPAGHSSSSSRSRNGAEREAEAHDGDDDDDDEEEEEDTAQDLDPDVDAYDDDHAEEDADVDSSEDEDEGDDDDDSDDYSSCSSENSHDMYSGNDDEDDEDSDNEEGGGASGVGENLTEEEEEEDDDESSGLTAEGGVLRFKLFKCEDLPAMDSNGACDPYVKLQVREPSLRDGEPKWWRRQPTRCGPVLCSSVVRESRRPVWEPPHCFDLVVDDFDAATLQVRMGMTEGARKRCLVIRLVLREGGVSPCEKAAGRFVVLNDCCCVANVVCDMRASFPRSGRGLGSRCVDAGRLYRLLQAAIGGRGQPAGRVATRRTRDHGVFPLAFRDGEGVRLARVAPLSVNDDPSTVGNESSTSLAEELQNHHLGVAQSVERLAVV